MTRYKILAIPIGLLLFILVQILFVEYSQDASQELEERRLDIQINYSVDAATDELIGNTRNLDMDYADFERLTIEPESALTTFCNVFMKGYAMSLSEENMSAVKVKYLPVFMVAAYDGYHVAKPTTINDSGAMDSIFEPKKAYRYGSGDKSYALNLGLQDAKLFDGNSIDKVEPPVSRQEQLRIINANISDDLMNRVYEHKGGDLHSTVYIPAEMTTISRTNPVKNVSVLAYITGIETGYGQAIESFGIGGARVTHEEFVGGYIRDGRKYYSYVKNIPKEVRVIATYENAMLAAEAGYYFDVRYE